MKKSLFLIFVVLLVCFSLVPYVSASEILIGANVISPNGTPKLYSLYPQIAGGLGQSFVAGDSGYLTEINYWLKEVGASNLVLSCMVVGIVGSNVANCTDILAVSSSTFATSDLTDSYAWYSFVFNQTFFMSEGSTYLFVLYVSTFTSGNSNNYVAVADRASPGSVTGGEFYSDGDYVWDGISTSDVIFSVYGDTDILAGESTPTPTPYVSPSPAVTRNVVPSVPFVAVPSYYMVLLVLFAVVAVLAGLYVMFEREGENKAVALLFGLVGLVIFVILIVGYFVGF